MTAPYHLGQRVNVLLLTLSSLRLQQSTDSSGPYEVTLSRKYAVGISLVPLEVVTFINPRRACARGLLRPCPSVRPLVGNSLLKRLFVLKTLSHTQGATKVKKLVGICLKPLRSGVMPRNRSEKPIANYSDIPAVSFLHLTHSEVPEGTQRLSTTFSLVQNYAY